MKAIIGIPCACKTLADGSGRDASFIPQSYLQAIEMVDGVPLLIPITDRENTLRMLYQQIDGLLLAGGKDIAPARYGEEPHLQLGPVNTQRDWVEQTLTLWALADEMPLLGVCRGIQTLNVATGGSLWQDIAAQVPTAILHRYYPDYPFDRLSHSVQLEPGSRLEVILGERELEVNSLHHQAVKKVGAGLNVTARSPDGMVEGLESETDAWVVAVQWHPENLLENVPRMKRLFAAFVAACQK